MAEDSTPPEKRRSFLEQLHEALGPAVRRVPLKGGVARGPLDLLRLRGETRMTPPLDRKRRPLAERVAQLSMVVLLLGVPALFAALQQPRVKAQHWPVGEYLALIATLGGVFLVVFLVALLVALVLDRRAAERARPGPQ